MGKKRPLPVMADRLWYKDAVIYQLHVKSFFDSDNDGVGDFPGLLQKLDYIASLGVNAIWLLPFYPSPHRAATTATTSPTTEASTPITARLPISAASSPARTSVTFASSPNSS
jgi:hypothetical protein